MLRAGLDLSGELLALAAASHGGEPAHLDGVRRILDGAGLRVDDLQNTPDVPLDPPAAACWRAEQRPPSPLAQNCSGKHAAMLATCRVAGWDTADLPRSRSPTATGGARDGRGPHRHSRRADRRGRLRRPAVLQHPGRARPGLRADRGRAARHPGRTGQRRRLRDHPWWVAGTDRDVVRLAAAVPGLIAKDGAEGVFAAALPDGRAVVLKVLDGAVAAGAGGGRGGAEGAGRRRAGARRGRAHGRARARGAGGPRRAGPGRPLRRLTGRRCRIATCRPASGPAARAPRSRRRANRCSGRRTRHPAR